MREANTPPTGGFAARTVGRRHALPIPANRTLTVREGIPAQSNPPNPRLFNNLPFSPTPFAPPALLYQGMSTPNSIEIDRAEINRANAQHSTGPKTEAGKQRSSLNALRHGLTGQIVVMPTEDLQAYQAHLNAQEQPSTIPRAPPESESRPEVLADTVWRA